MKPVRVTIVSRDNCHLCKVVYRVATHLQHDLPFNLDTVDVDSDQRLLIKYGDRVPVVLINEREALAGKVTAGDLRRAVEKARWRNPVSRILSRVKLALTRG